MPTPFLPRRPGAATTPPETADAAWRCTRCDKLLGVRRGGRLHLRHSRNHEYLVCLPVSATCRACGTLNELSGPA